MIDELLGLLQPAWPKNWTADPNVVAALERLIDDLRHGRPTSLPIVQKSKTQIAWLSISGSVRELRDYLEDAKAWLARCDGNAIGNDVRKPSGPLAPMLTVLAPQGYARWDTSLERGELILLRLAKMQNFLASRPAVSQGRIPSLPALRLEFISALRVGDWVRAEACVDEIDHWNLAHATVTLQMRIRLFEARGDTAELFNFIVNTKAWNIANPRRIAAVIVTAIDVGAIQPVETRDGIAAAYDLFRTSWYPQLVHCIGDARGDRDSLRLVAFAAAVDGDERSLKEMLPDLPTALGEFLRAQLPAEDPARFTVITPVTSVVSTAAPQVVSPTGITSSPFWTTLREAVAEGRVLQVRNLIASVDPDQFDDPDFIGMAPDALLEVLSDPAIGKRADAKLLLYEVLAGLVDAFIMAPGFPRLTHLDIYFALLDGLVALRGAAANDADSQLVLGLVGAAANLDADACPRCEQVVSAWWQRRPIIQRLDWLAGALDSLASLDSNPTRLVGLYADGLHLAARKGVVFTASQEAIWHSIGKGLELSLSDIDQYLAPLLPSVIGTNEDLLSHAALRQIAIVSLRESSAQEAANQLEARTGAKVSIVSSLVAGAETRHALSANLILYVWAATSHATYRAFDGCRDKIEYVQGTGASSIVLAAERWVARQGASSLSD